MEKDELSGRREATAEALVRLAKSVVDGECAALLLTAVCVQEPPVELAFNAGGMAELGLLMGLSGFTRAKVEQGVLMREAMRAAAPADDEAPAPAPAPSNPFAAKGE